MKLHVNVLLIDDSDEQLDAMASLLSKANVGWLPLAGEEVELKCSLFRSCPDRNALIDPVAILKAIDPQIISEGMDRAPSGASQPSGDERDPGVVVVDMRLRGDDCNDLSGVDLALQIKSRFPDCCVVLVSSHFQSTPMRESLQHFELLRSVVDRGNPLKLYDHHLLETFEKAVQTYASNRLYRNRRFVDIVNSGRPRQWGLVLPPGDKGSWLNRDLALPALNGHSVVVKTLEIGVCATDRKALGLATNGPTSIVAFHECFGRVVWVGEDVRDFSVGDLVVPMVRRCQCWDDPKAEIVQGSHFSLLPCENIKSCESAHQPDRCPVGRYTRPTADGRRAGYTSCGTGRCHGFGSQYFADMEDWLVRVELPKDEQFANQMMQRYVLTEPLSIVWKMRREVLKHYPLRDTHHRVLIIGLGPIGLLALTLFRELHPGLSVTAVDLADPANPRVRLMKKHYSEVCYIQAEHEDRCPKGLEGCRFQVVVEATDQPENVFKYAPDLLAPGGIAVLLGISEEGHEIALPAEVVSNLVRQGNMLLGSINSSRSDFDDSLSFLRDVIGPKESLLDDGLIQRWDIDENLPERLQQQMGQKRPRDREEIKVVLRCPSTHMT